MDRGQRELSFRLEYAIFGDSVRLFYNIYGVATLGVLLGFAVFSHAAEGDASAKRFFPLAPARAGVPARAASPILLKPEDAAADASSSGTARAADAPAAGFMTIDRAKVSLGSRVSTAPAAKADAPPPSPIAPAAASTAASPAAAPAAVKPGALESEEIEGNTEKIDPVLALYGDAPPAASSFAEAMRGVAASALRHLGWPIPLSMAQYISSGYGMRQDPFTHIPTFHGGIDIVAKEGTPVLATADAVVKQVATDRNYGHYITLEHADGTLSRYGHLSAQAVREGQSVRQGQAIGAVGATGRATGPHLDYRVSREGTKFDPLAILSVPKEVSAATTSHRTLAGAHRPLVRKVSPIQRPHAPMVIEVRE